MVYSQMACLLLVFCFLASFSPIPFLFVSPVVVFLLPEGMSVNILPFTNSQELQ